MEDQTDNQNEALAGAQGGRLSATWKYPISEEDAQEIERIFCRIYGKNQDQMLRVELIREAARKLVITIVASSPACSDRTAAIRKVREAMMTAIAAIEVWEHPFYAEGVNAPGHLS